MIAVHHLNDSRSQRIIWMLEELQLDYEIKCYQREADTSLAPASLKRIHPLGKAPILVDNEIVLAESGAIIDYLAHHYGTALLPEADTPAWWDYVYWLHYAEGSLMPPLWMGHVLDKVQQAPMPFFVRPVAKKLVAGINDAFLSQQLHTHLNFVADHLACHEWFLGDAFSSADIQMSFPLEAAMHNPILADRYPRINAYVAQLQARPAYLQALAKGGTYVYGPKITV